MVLPSTSTRGLRLLAEKIRMAVEALAVPPHRCRALADTERHHAVEGALVALARLVPDDRGAFAGL